MMTRSIAVAAAAVLAAASVTLSASPVVTPEEAIRAVVLARLGLRGGVAVSEVVTRVAGEPALVAQPDAAARLGSPARFVL
jgi:hypothetical protein